MPKTSVGTGTTGGCCESCQSETPHTGIPTKDIESILNQLPMLVGSDFEHRERAVVDDKRNHNFNKLKGRPDISRTDIAKAVLKPELEELVRNYILPGSLQLNLSELVTLKNSSQASPGSKNNFRIIIRNRFSLRYSIEGQDPQDSSLSLEAKKCVIFCTGSEIIGKWNIPLAKKRSIEAIFNKTRDGQNAGIYYSGKL